MARLPSKQFHLLSGGSGVGKTTLFLQAWAAHEKGESFPLQYPEDADSVAIITADRPKVETEEHCEALGIKNAEIYGIPDDLTLDTTLFDNKPALWKEVMSKFKKSHKFYILDPLGLLFPNNLNDYSKVAASCIFFTRFCLRNNVTLMGVHHTSKQRRGNEITRPQDMINGSTAFAAYTGTQIVMMEGSINGNAEDDLLIIPHRGKKEPYKLARREDGYFILASEGGKIRVLRQMQGTRATPLDNFLSMCAVAGMTRAEALDWVAAESVLSMSGDHILYSED